jgi:hypothetical protein
VREEKRRQRWSRLKTNVSLYTLTDVNGAPFAYAWVGEPLTTEGSMSLKTLHDKARNLGLGLMYEKHWGHGGFRDLFDQTSSQWAATDIAEKVVDLRAFELAGVPVGELIQHYRETYACEADAARILDNLAATMQTYRRAGYAPPLPEDVAVAVNSPRAN